MLEFWLFVALLIVVAIAWKPFKTNVIGALDARSEAIRKELDEAARLREEAQAMLADYQRKLHSGEEQTRDIVEHARVESERQTARMRRELEETLRRRTEQAEARIAQEEARALQEVRAQAAELAIRATRKLLASEVDDGRKRTLVDDAIGQVRNRLAS